jgi:hypothetical protein
LHQTQQALQHITTLVFSLSSRYVLFMAESQSILSKLGNKATYQQGGPVTTDKRTFIGYQKVKSWVDGKPVHIYTKFFSVVCSFLLGPIAVLGLITSMFSIIRWIVAIYLVLGATLVVLSIVPTKFRILVHRYFLFLALTHGRGAFLFMLGLMAIGMGFLGLMVGLFTIGVAIAHLVLWNCFKEKVIDDVLVDSNMTGGDDFDNIYYNASPLDETQGGGKGGAGGTTGAEGQLGGLGGGGGIGGGVSSPYYSNQFSTTNQSTPIGAAGSPTLGVQPTYGSYGTVATTTGYGTVTTGVAPAATQPFNQASYGSDTTVITGTAGYRV